MRYIAPMRAFLPALCLATLFALTGSMAPAAADSCGDLIDKVVAGTRATLVKRTHDFAELSAGDGIGMTLACGELSAVGVQFKGPSLPEAYFPLFGRAGHATTGIAAEVIAEAGRKARAEAATTRHSNVDAGIALVTCTIATPAGGPVTACAVIDKDGAR